MKNKINLLFAFLYFTSILLGLLSNVFNPLFSDIYYGHLTNILSRVVRVIIYAIIAIILPIIYKRFVNKEEIENHEKKTLPLKKTLILYGVTLFFITIISIIAGWQLKPLSDLGDKYTIIELYAKLTNMVILTMEIYLMMKSFQHYDKYYVSNFKNYKNFSLSIIFVLLTYSIYSLITNFDIYQLIFIPFTILLGFIYPYTEKSFAKTYLIAVLVFLF